MSQLFGAIVALWLLYLAVAFTRRQVCWISDVATWPAGDRGMLMVIAIVAVYFGVFTGWIAKK